MGARVLLAEDNPFNQQVAQELLESVGANVTIANNGTEVLHHLARQPFHVVLMDVQMPEMDGYEATRHIRSMPHLASQRVIAMTANAMTEDRHRCLAAGMDDFITKPIEPNGLYMTIARWMPESNAKRAEKAQLALAAVVDAAEAASSSINLTILGNMVNNDPVKIHKFALMFVSTARDTLVEMDVAYGQRDLITLGNLGHKLKSSAKTVGAMGFASLCQALEVSGKTGDWQQAEILLPQLPLLLERIAQQVEQELQE
jgi:CheY-like chemotaxis protein